MSSLGAKVTWEKKLDRLKAAVAIELMLVLACRLYRNITTIKSNSHEHTFPRRGESMNLFKLYSIHIIPEYRPTIVIQCLSQSLVNELK